MRAVVCTQYGPPETLAVGELALPVARDGQVGVHAAAARYLILGFVLMYSRQRRPDLLRRSWDESMAMLADRRLRPATPVPLPRDHGPAAMRALMDRAVTGRIVLDPHC